MRSYYPKQKRINVANDFCIRYLTGQRKRPLAGFTITEVVIAIMVIGISSAALMSCFKYGFKVIRQIQENQRATQIMMEKAETLRLYSWDQVNTSGFIPASFSATYDGDTAASNYSGTIYSGTVSIVTFPYTTAYTDKMRALNLTLTWTSDNMSRTRSLTTFIAKDGIQNYVY